MAQLSLFETVIFLVEAIDHVPEALRLGTDFEVRSYDTALSKAFVDEWKLNETPQLKAKLGKFLEVFDDFPRLKKFYDKISKPAPPLNLGATKPKSSFESLRGHLPCIGRDLLDPRIAEGCGDPNCTHKHGEEPSLFKALCHPHAPLDVAYFDGVLTIECSFCRQVVANLKIAES